MLHISEIDARSVKNHRILDLLKAHQCIVRLFIQQPGPSFKKQIVIIPALRPRFVKPLSGCFIPVHTNKQLSLYRHQIRWVFAKKSQSINIDGDVYIAEVESFTHKCKNQVIVSKKFLSADDHVLLIDDFLANGYALQGLISIVQQAGGTVEGIGIAIEKGFQYGGRTIRNLGYHLESLAIVDGMDPETGEVIFREQ